MKYCPVCDERYDEDIIRFCTKDGTPLVEESQPSFTTLPSEAAEDTVDLGEETIVRRKPPVSAGSATGEDLSGRIVIPATPEAPAIRQRTATTYYPPPQQPNTAKTVVLTILGTLAVVGFGAGLFWLMSGGSGGANLFENQNVLANQNININTNLGFDSNFNFNTNANFNTGIDTNLNTNLNSNLRSPSPTPTARTSPTPSPEPSPSPDRSPTPERSPTPRTSPTVSTTPRPAVSPTVRFTPRPTTSNSNTR